MNGPETKDSDFKWKEFIKTNNSSLVGLLGNFINRVLIFTANNFDNTIPKSDILDNFKDKLFKLYCDVGDNIEEGNFKNALNHIMDMIKYANKFFDDEKPWVTVKENRERCKSTIYTCIYIICNLSNLIEPFMPFTAEKIRSFLDIDNRVWMPIDVKTDKIKKIEILFERIDKDRAVEEIEILKNKKLLND